MFFKRKEKKYNISDLHIVKLGTVTEKSSDGATLTYLKQNPFAIVTCYNHQHTFRQCENCYDFFSYTQYYLFTGVSKKYDFKYTYIAPVSQFFPTQEYITKPELIKLYNDLNGIKTIDEKELIKEEDEKEKIEDNILKLISAEIDKINLLNLENKKRVEMLNSLKDIAEYYVTNYINIKSEKQQNINFESPLAQLKLECSKRIAEIDAQLYETAQNDDLLDQLNIVKKKTLK